LEWEKERRKLMRTDVKNRLYSIQMPEIDKEIVKATEMWMERLKPAIVFLDGSPASEELQICSPEAASKYVEKDYVGINEDFRAIMAQNVGAEVVYLDEGFEEINLHYRIQKRKNEAIFLLDEMIRQIMEKESYSISAMKDPRTLDNIAVKDPENCKSEWWYKVFTRFDLVTAKTTALWVQGEANFPEDPPFVKHYVSADTVLKNEKDIKKIQSLRLEGRTLEGREVYWAKRSEEKISQLPEHSQVLFVIEARYVGFQHDLDSFNSTKEFDLPRDAVVDWGVKDYRSLPPGKFQEKLSRFGEVSIVDLTQEKMKKALEHNWKIR
jgi:hypothetical protein